MAEKTKLSFAERGEEDEGAEPAADGFSVGVPFGTSTNGSTSNDDEAVVDDGSMVVVGVYDEEVTFNGTSGGVGEVSQEEQLLLEKYRRRGCYVKLAIALVLLGLIIYVIVDSTTSQHVKNGIFAFLQWIEENPGKGVVLFILGNVSQSVPVRANYAYAIHR